MRLWALPIVVAAAFLLGLGFVIQQRVAQKAPPTDFLRFRLLLDLARKPMWLLGIGCMVAGQVLGAVALGLEDVTLVEPLLTTNLLFALALTYLVTRQPVGRSEWTGAVLLSAGVTAFLVAGQPAVAHGSVGFVRKLAVLSAIAATALVFYALGRRVSGYAKATLLAAAAGTLYGLQDGFTRRAVLLLDTGIHNVLVSWQPYIVLVVAIIGLMLAQSAFEIAPLHYSLPAMTAAEPLSGIFFGIGIFGEHIRLTPERLGVEAAGLLAMVIGVVLVARSRVLVRS